MLDADFVRPPSSAPNPLFSTDRRRRSLRRAAEALVLVHPSVKRLPDDDTVTELADELMIAADDFVAINAVMSRREVTLVCVCSAAWCGEGRRTFLELKAAAEAIGRTVVLVPERFIRREPRLGNALLVAGAEGVEIGLTDRMKILAHLVENGGDAPLLDLAGMVRGPDPVAAVLGLVVEGGLYMDLDRPIVPSTAVHLVQPL